mmetsp:Transcript_3722/g.2937  ORF Transcript_3722/g.2937 Transcript_3722/m.2937 type:complete len:98 (-) Transcript_3722:37-330(-)
MATDPLRNGMTVSWRRSVFISTIASAQDATRQISRAVDATAVKAGPRRTSGTPAIEEAISGKRLEFKAADEQHSQGLRRMLPRKSVHDALEKSKAMI